MEVASQTPSRSSSAETIVSLELEISRDRTPPRRKCSGSGRPHDQAAGGTDEAAETDGAVSTRVPVPPLWGYRGVSLPVVVGPVPAHEGTDEAAEQGGAVSTRVPVPPSAISWRRKKLENEVGALTAAADNSAAELAKKRRDDLAEELKKAEAAAKNGAGKLEAAIRQLEKDLAEAGKASEALAASAAGVQAGEHDHFSVPLPPPLDRGKRAVVASQTAHLASTPPAMAADEALKNGHSSTPHPRVLTFGSSKPSALWQRRYGSLEHPRSAPPPSFLRVPCADREHCA